MKLTLLEAGRSLQGISEPDRSQHAELPHEEDPLVRDVAEAERERPAPWPASR